MIAQVAAHPPKAKRGPGFFSHSKSPLTEKTRPTAEGGYKKRHSYKVLPTQFRHGKGKAEGAKRKDVGRAMPEAYALRNFYWQFFVTLTLPRSKALQISRVFTWLRETATLGHIHFRRLFWVLRFEFGPKGSHGHYHLCLAGLPPALITRQLCRVLESKWWTIAGGLSEVTSYDHARDGVRYVLKLPPQSSLYHPRKGGVFRSDGEDCEPMLSASLIEAVRRGRM